MFPRCGKITIGAHYALKKLEKIKEAKTADDRKSLADTAIKRTNDKHIVLPPLLQKALDMFAKPKKT